MRHFELSRNPASPTPLGLPRVFSQISACTRFYSRAGSPTLGTDVTWGSDTTRPQAMPWEPLGTEGLQKSLQCSPITAETVQKASGKNR